MKLLSRMASPFSRLQWKLTFSYTLITVLALLVVEILFAILVVWGINQFIPYAVMDSIQSEATQAATYFVAGKPDKEKLSNWIPQVEDDQVLIETRRFTAVVDSKGQVVVSEGRDQFPANSNIQARLPAQAAPILHKALSSGSDGSVQSMDLADGGMLIIAPIVDKDDNVVGALVSHVVNARIPLLTIFPPILLAILLSALIFLIFAGFVGAIFGALTARGFTKRFSNLALAVENWSRGNFSTFVKDSSGDELGSLSRRLNLMAEQLQQLLQTRQKLATLEERNRLARDLHDSVKQQVFAVSMQVSTAKALLSNDSESAKTHLNEAERLVRQAQQELNSLIRELRPVGLEGKGLALALQEYVLDWMGQTAISAVVNVEGEQALAQAVEEAMFRVAQEALANVARHSQASSVQLCLLCEKDLVTLSIADDGKGFEVSARRGQGVGLQSMRERMQTLHGQVEIKSIKGKGTTVIARCEPGAVSV
ncbi:HAMP domain-containing protein [Ktedonosporobacter rubrisoli]|uniref:HAMP domain-containing protein n=1 Tax=Ktedonosporobacter rubrisoli TaxID=2509675 RepID=A0A4P6JVH0_KTERU|nr:sensor histidine kinase [Ktedonosporobacter rubrisoli]QBD79330.1 HAMP domain-containing protein [Ktedonosporobacter rubrisoli]